MAPHKGNCPVCKQQKMLTKVYGSAVCRACSSYFVRQTRTIERWTLLVPDTDCLLLNTQWYADKGVWQHCLFGIRFFLILRNDCWIALKLLWNVFIMLEWRHVQIIAQFAIAQLRVPEPKPRKDNPKPDAEVMAHIKGGGSSKGRSSTFREPVFSCKNCQEVIQN